MGLLSDYYSWGLCVLSGVGVATYSVCFTLCVNSVVIVATFGFRVVIVGLVLRVYLFAGVLMIVWVGCLGWFCVWIWWVSLVAAFGLLVVA